MALTKAGTATALHLAAGSGDVDKVRELLELGEIDVNCTDKSNQTPAHYASLGGHLAVMRILVSEFKADLDQKDTSGNTPLILAAKNKHHDLFFDMLEDYDCKVDETALEAIIGYGFDPKRTAFDGRTLLHYACQWGDVELARILVNNHKLDIHSVACAMFTPILMAVVHRQHKVVTLFVEEFGCDPNSADYTGKTLLHYACEFGDAESAWTLIKNKASIDPIIDAIAKEKGISLDFAGLSSGMKMIRLIVDVFGHDPNLPDFIRIKRTLLHTACEWLDVDAVSHLIRKHKCDIGACDLNGCTPLHLAAIAGNIDVVISLVKDFDCDVNVAAKYGFTPLQMASGSGHEKVVKFLLHSASPLLTNALGRTPLHMAAASDHLETVKMLVKANVPLMGRDVAGGTPYDVAEGASREFLAEFLRKNRKQIQASYKKVSTLAKNKYSGSHYITRVFVLGNPGAGKSSLIESLKREGFLKSFRKVSESTVPLHTAGIIPSVHISSKYGRVIFYDFAGDAEYYSSHAAIFESIASSRKGNNIFILVVDLMEDDEKIEAILHYWLSFIRYQKFENLSIVVVGSHLDSCEAVAAETKALVLDHFCAIVPRSVQNVKHFMLDCRNPRSNQIAQFKQQIFQWVRDSQKYEISDEASLLLGLLEKDFGAVTACPVKTIQSHIKDCGVWVPTDTKALHQVLLELHEVGVLLLLGDYTTNYYHAILDVSKLTNEVHKLLFAESALADIKKVGYNLKTTNSFNIGVLPERILSKILPSHITKECLVHFQYCQQISHSDVGILEGTDATDKELLFFPAYCSVDKSEVSWKASTEKNFSLGWLALCADPYSYFPPRFLHVLLLRLVHRFTLSVPTQLQAVHASPEHSSRCTMWKKGVHWKMEEGVDSMVELVNESKGVVILCKSAEKRAEICASVFVKILSCVMEAKAEFCHSIKLLFFLLDSCIEAEYMSQDHQFALSDVQRAFESPQGREVIISVSGRGELELSKLQCLKKLTHWGSLFSIDVHSVLRVLEVVVDRVSFLGQMLGAPPEFLRKLQVNYPNDVDRRKRELVMWWMSSTLETPCWWRLAEALKDAERSVLAEEIIKTHGVHIQLQEKLLSEETETQNPDEEFLCSLSGVVRSRWPSLAVSLALSKEEIEELKGKVGLTQEDLAFEMLKIWSLKEGATYGQLCLKLKTIALFQYSSSK